MPAALLRYLRDCYEEDNRRSAIWNVFGRSIDHRLFVEGREEVLTGELSQLPVHPEETAEMRQTAELYRRERELLYGSLFIAGSFEAGRNGFGDGSRTVCAPLLIYPARFVERGPHLFVEPDLTDERVNSGLLEMLCGLDDSFDLSGAVREVVRPGTLDFGDMLALKELLEHGISGGCAASLLDYPELVSEAELRSAGRRLGRHRGEFQAFAASAVLLAPRSRASRGVVTELEAMAEAPRLSPPVRVLLGEEVPEEQGADDGYVVPAVMSGAQRQIVRSAASRPSSLVIGPPGTGKSFTIAALAIEQMARGRNVLIASKMEHAVTVIEEIIERELGIGGCVVRGGPPAQRKKLANYVRELLDGMHTRDVPEEEVLTSMRGDLQGMSRKVARLEHSLERRARQEAAWSRSLADDDRGPFGGVKERWAGWRLEHSRPLWEIAREIDEVEADVVRQSRHYVQALYRRRLWRLLRNSRRTIQTLDRALRARTSGRQASLFGDVDREVLFQAFPIWLVTLADVADLLPLEPELFDLVIIDEATQCDIASSLPVLQRARRSVVVGDPRQLRHISFLATNRQKALAEKHALPFEALHDYDYRAHSILDLADRRLESQDAVAFLDEHFRSAPDIIRFSNERFYAGRLRVMTDHPGRPRAAGLTLHLCEGARDEEGVNAREAERVVSDVKTLVEAECDLPPDQCRSIGVLSPFRSQVDALANLLASELDAEAVRRHRLMLGTAHSFQGEERDVMFLSLAIDPQTHSAAIRYMERPDVFNVAITRARTAQSVYLSIEAKALLPGSLLRAYLEQIGEVGIAAAPTAPPEAFGAARGEVAEAFAREGLQLLRGHPLAGLTIDLVALNGRRACGVELVGFPPDFATMLQRERYQVLGRAGLPMVPISYARWRHDRAGCLAAVRRTLEAE